MKKIAFFLLVFSLTVVTAVGKTKRPPLQLWPDGTEISAWFADTSRVDVSGLKHYDVTDYGVDRYADGVQTKELQAVIDRCASEGGGVIVIPRGIFLSGSLFFKPGTHLLIEEGGELKGSDRIRDFKIVKTRMEGQTLDYFAALVNADGVDGFTITGPGTINGNGQKYWEEFWIRRKYNPQCTNMEAMRPRNVYISNSKNVTVQDVKIINSPFWTNHLYRCENVRYLGCFIYAPTENVTPVDPRRGGPSTDAIDLDVCSNVLTESLDDRNVILRRIHVKSATRVLWLKMRPDTPQHYEYVTVEDITGKCGSFLVVRPWTQFFKPEAREDMPLSQCNNIVMRNIKMDCKNFFDVGASDKYRLKDFTFENVNVGDETDAFDKAMIENTTVKNVIINGKSR